MRHIIVNAAITSWASEEMFASRVLSYAYHAPRNRVEHHGIGRLSEANMFRAVALHNPGLLAWHIRLYFSRQGAASLILMAMHLCIMPHQRNDQSRPRLATMRHCRVPKPWYRCSNPNPNQAVD